MLKTFFSTLLLVATIVAFGQNDLGKNDDLGRIILNTYVPDQIEGLTPTAKNSLENKLNQITTANGMGGSALNPRFIITANIVVLTKDITPTAPPMHAYTLDVTLYIGDGIEGTKFASHSVTLKGVGENETKAYLAALKNLKPSDPQYQVFLEKGKKKIIEYYNTRCDFLIKEAETLASTYDFDGAIYKLSGVPEVAKDCYDKTLAKLTELFKAKIERECQTNLVAAKAAIAQNKYDEAAQYLAAIFPDSKCYPEAAKLVNEVNAWYKKEFNRLWDFELRQYKDAVDLEKARIGAARDVGVAYGNNQPSTVYNVKGWW